ncbi:hypothetical protein EI42_01610 [Thermosporothrix hazakensis]|jgi:hypothetical protein|uniref:Uncharacterized protein n=1 Tax=Thermosporothrix hazakensis TaxID=644383 RepID=A0A326UAK6_THEHA|nr:hypothetical protein EI42_01610 [Thermosporothrix hazakensis]
MQMGYCFFLFPWSVYIYTSVCLVNLSQVFFWSHSFIYKYIYYNKSDK